MAGVINRWGLRSRKTSASGRVSGLWWYISPNMKAVRLYLQTEYHSGECRCSLVVSCISLFWYMQTWLKLSHCLIKLLLTREIWWCYGCWTFVDTRVEGSNSSEMPSPLPHTLSKNVPSSALAVPQYSGGLGTNSSKLESPSIFSFPYTCFWNLASDIFKLLSFLLRGSFHWKV